MLAAVATQRSKKDPLTVLLAPQKAGWARKNGRNAIPGCEGARQS